MYRRLLRAAGGGQSRSIDEIPRQIPSLSLIRIYHVGPGRGPRETSPIVDQFGNREDGSSGEYPYADDPSAQICVSDDCVEFRREVSADIFGRHGPNYLPNYYRPGTCSVAPCDAQKKKPSAAKILI